MMRVRETDTHLIPYSAAEVEWARRRPPEHRTPIPKVGDAVLYRHEPWGDVVPAVVDQVEDLEDRTAPNNWEVLIDPATGAYICTPDGRPVAERRPDPWPVLHVASRHGIAITQEARLRGSAGWLPLDWQTRHRPLPQIVIAR